VEHQANYSIATTRQTNTKLTMSDYQALVIDNGSGMCKAGFSGTSLIPFLFILTSRRRCAVLRLSVHDRASQAQGRLCRRGYKGPCLRRRRSLLLPRHVDSQAPDRARYVDQCLSLLLFINLASDVTVIYSHFVFVLSNFSFARNCYELGRHGEDLASHLLHRAPRGA
jgi:hypothetical protein